MMGRENLKKARKEAGTTQQQMADELDIGLRQYQRIEAGTSHGTFEIWDKLEDITGIHQRILREISENHHAPKDSQLTHPANRQF